MSKWAVACEQTQDSCFRRRISEAARTASRSSGAKSCALHTGINRRGAMNLVRHIVAPTHED